LCFAFLSQDFFLTFLLLAIFHIFSVSADLSSSAIISPCPYSQNITNYGKSETMNKTTITTRDSVVYFSPVYINFLTSFYLRVSLMIFHSFSISDTTALPRTHDRGMT